MSFWDRLTGRNREYERQMEQMLNRVATVAGSRYEGMEADLDQSVRAAKMQFPSATREGTLEIGTAWLTRDIEQRRSMEEWQSQEMGF